MKKLNKNSKLLALALIGCAAMAQACGKSGTPTMNVAGTGVNGSSLVGSGLDTTLANACNAGGLAGLQGYGLYNLIAIPATASDGTSVCKLSFEEIFGNPSFGISRSYLGPNSSNAPLTTSIYLDPYDQAQIAVNGTYDTGVFGGCGSNSVDPLMYGQLPGVLPELVNGATLNVPLNGGGYLQIGLNQSSGTGEMCIMVQANVTRCLDSSGRPHHC